MLKHIKHLLTRNSLTIAVLVTLAIAYLSLAKVSGPSFNISSQDKVLHCIAYFVLTFFWLLAFRNNQKKITIVLITCVFYGILIEVLQVTLTNYRYGEYLDIAANISGTLLALLIFNYFFKK